MSIQDEVLALKKISSKISRDVRRFWLKINKVVAFKQKLDADEVRQKVGDLNDILGCLAR
jgi:E1A-binding protein p400